MASYARKHSRREIAIRFGINDPYGNPSKGLVKLLLDGYEPRTPETRTRLGLPAKIKEPRHHRTINDHLANDAIQDMPSDLLGWAFQNREELS
jgi:hypothetical protein